MLSIKESATEKTKQKLLEHHGKVFIVEDT